MVNNISQIVDQSGRFYAGMSIQEAQIKGYDKSFWRRDFSNIDKNKNGVLSIKEIINERKRSSKMYTLSGLPFTLLSMYDMLKTHKTNSSYNLVQIGLDVLIGICLFAKGIGIHMKTKEYENIVKNNVQ